MKSYNLIAVLLLSLCIILAEAGLQMFRPASIPSIIKQASPPWIKLDDYCFWHNQPLGAFTWISWQGLPNVVYTDQRGFRISDKPQNNSRILCLGDSSTFGLGVNYETSYPALLDAENGGVVGFTVVNILYYLQAYAFQPETNIVTIMAGWNDVSLDKFIESPIHGTPLRVRRMLLKSAIVRNWRELTLKIAGKYTQGYQLDTKRLVPEEKYMWALSEIFKEIELSGRKVYYVEMPVPDREFMLTLGNHALRHSGLVQRAAAVHYQTLARRVCAEVGIPYIETQAVFNDWAEEDVYLDQVHPTAIGHQVIAKQIAGRLKADKVW